MFRKLPFYLAVFVMFSLCYSTAGAETIATSWSGDAEMIYDTGFMHMLMKHPEGGVCLFNMELIENDSPSAGFSEKGVSQDAVWGENQARKLLYLDDPRAEKAYLVFFFTNQGKYPLRFAVNGKHTKVENWDQSKFHLGYRWTEFPVEWLKKGKNVIELYCPEAQSEDEGWTFYLARADEFEHGGGDPEDVGKTSFKSTDGGESWKESPFGPLGKTRAEYSIRISFDRYVKTGWLASPAIDLWNGDSEDFITPVRVFKKMKLTIQSDVPDETTVEYYLRKGTDPDPFSDEWSPYELIGEGDTINLEMNDREINGRYVQLRVVLSTKNPLKTPVVKSTSLTAELLQGFTSHESVKVVKADNPVIKYSSVNWEWEPWDRPEFKEVRDRENLDGVVAGSKTQYEKILKLLEYAATRVSRKYIKPHPDYPGWDALSILERIDRHGTMGMCIQFNNAFMGMCMVYGMQGRLINGVNHELAEVWSDDFGKWVYFEASYANHYLYDIEKGMPMSMLDLHNIYLDYLFPDYPIDWMNDLTSAGYATKQAEEREDKPPVKRSSTTYHQKKMIGTSPTFDLNETVAYKGLVQSAFMRAVPRNNFYEKPYPIPLSHGSFWWPWNGYINWYDERTPPHRQYSWHTDKPRDMWPDLNLVHVDATCGHSNKFLFLRFETYTPNFSHFEVDENDTGWKKVEGDRWTWVLASGRSDLRVRAVNKLGAKGKPSVFEINRSDVPLEDLF